MERRQFLRNATLAGVSVPAIVTTSCISTGKKSTEETDQKAVNPVDFALNETTIDMLQAKMASGELTSAQITGMYLQRIADIDKGGIGLNAVIELNPDVRDMAAAMDEERKNGKVRGPLHGIPVLIKDNIDTGDKMMTTAGSLALEGNKASKDAFIVGKLREAGAVLLGKTNLSEWANFRSTHSSSGWSSRGGQTHNPYLIDRSPCGSSSGSGVAVSANLCAVAIGTETNGSISCPSSINGVVGIKPTVGLWSRSGIIPISKTQDTAGPMARTVKDAAILLGALTGIDSADESTEASRGKSYADYTQFLKATDLKGKRLGVEKSFLRVNENVDALLQNAMDILKNKGAEIVEVDVISALNGLNQAEEDVLEYEFKDGLNKYLAGANAKVKTLKELIEFDQRHEFEVMPYFKQEIFESAEKKGGLDSGEYKEQWHKLVSTARGSIDRVMKENNLAAIFGPANGPAWCTDLINGNSFTGYGTYGPAAMAGYPSITVPMGMVFGLPIGLTFYAGAYCEPELLGIAGVYEQASKKRTMPGFQKALELVSPPRESSNHG